MGHAEVTALLLEKARDTIDVNLAVNFGATPLAMACFMGHTQVVDLFLHKCSRAMVLRDYEPTNDDELRLKAGQKLLTLAQDRPGWWYGKIEGTIGLFPYDHVKLL